MSETVEHFLKFWFIVVGAFFCTAAYFATASVFNYGSFHECQPDQVNYVEWDPIPGTKCIDYAENRDLILERIKGLELPATESTIAKVTPDTSKGAVAAVLERYQKETGDVYRSYDNGITQWNFYNTSRGEQ